MANDINDILGINLPKEEPASKSKIISDLLQNLVFSLGQGYSAQGGARGSQARSAGIGAALQGPMVLQQIRDKQQADAQERQINLVKARELFRQNRNAEAMDLLKIRTQLPEETTMTPPPAPTEPVIEGTPETGLTVKSLGTPTYAKPRPEMITLPNGQQVPISPPSAGDVRNQGYAADARTAALEEVKRQIEAKYRAPQNVDPNSQSVLDSRLAYETALSKIPQRPTGTPPPVRYGVEVPLPPAVEEQRKRIAAANAVNRAPIAYADLDPTKKAQVDAVAAKVASGEFTVANGQGMLGGVRGGLGGALTEALTNTLVLPTAVRTANSDIERAKNLLVPVHNLVAEINQTSDLSKKIEKSAQLENYVRAIGTQFARAKGERGVVTDKDVDRVLGLIPGWKSANFAPGFAEDNLKLVEDAFNRDQQALLSKYFTKFNQGGAGQTQTPGTTKPNTSGWRILNKP